MKELGKYFISSLESYEFEEPRSCIFIKKILIDSKKEAAIVEISPPVNGQTYGYGKDIKRLILAHRHEGYGLFNITKFPCFVFVAIADVDNLEDKSDYKSYELKIIAWAELYRTISDAKNHTFD